MDKLDEIIELLQKDKPLLAKAKDHNLKGNWTGFRDCHIEPDWVLIYQKDENNLILARTGSHSELNLM